MGQVRTRKGAFGTPKGPKTAEQKISERPVLFSHKTAEQKIDKRPVMFLITVGGLTVQCGRSRNAELSRDAT